MARQTIGNRGSHRRNEGKMRAEESSMRQSKKGYWEVISSEWVCTEDSSHST